MFGSLTADSERLVKRLQIGNDLGLLKLVFFFVGDNLISFVEEVNLGSEEGSRLGPCLSCANWLLRYFHLIFRRKMESTTDPEPLKPCDRVVRVRSFYLYLF